MRSTSPIDQKRDEAIGGQVTAQAQLPTESLAIGQVTRQIDDYTRIVTSLLSALHRGLDVAGPHSPRNETRTRCLGETKGEIQRRVRVRRIRRNQLHIAAPPQREDRVVGPHRLVATAMRRRSTESCRKRLDADLEVRHREDEMVENQSRLMKMRRMYQNIIATDAKSWRAAPT